ncbi:MAG: DEAD/DEAH box helicase [Asgard group archaeon]|nr:DEAD/DEAH box helicase [Asgard group archaeon]
MPKVSRKIVPREYQKIILDLINFHQNKGKSVLLELDCGMGKRVITYKLLTDLYKSKNIILLVLSSSSFLETKQFLIEEYGGVEGFNWLGSGTNTKYAQKLLSTGRVILSTPQKFANILQKSDEHILDRFDIIIINEIDKLVRRMGSKRVLVYPWPSLLDYFGEKTVIGMSGTLRDSHYVLDREQIELRKELDTLQEFIPNTELILMEYLAGTDVNTFTKKTTIDTIAVDDHSISEISSIIGQEIKETYKEIRAELKEIAPEFLAKAREIGPQVYLQAPITDELRSRAQSLALLRKYLYSMIPQQLQKFFWKLPDVDSSALPVVPQKFKTVAKIAQESEKTVILCSYIKTVKTIEKILKRLKIKTFRVTGRIFDKNSVLQDFRKFSGQAVLLMSPVGERDIDLPEAEQLIIFDCVRTTKTVYQQLKRIRGGLGRFLYYKDTYEEKKVKAVIQDILQKYPWSVEIKEENTTD